MKNSGDFYLFLDEKARRTQKFRLVQNSKTIRSPSSSKSAVGSDQAKCVKIDTARVHSPNRYVMKLRNIGILLFDLCQVCQNVPILHRNIGNFGTASGKKMFLIRRGVCIPQARIAHITHQCKCTIPTKNF